METKWLKGPLPPSLKGPLPPYGDQVVKGPLLWIPCGSLKGPLPPSLKGPLPPYGDQVVKGPTPDMETRWFLKGLHLPMEATWLKGLPLLWRPGGSLKGPLPPSLKGPLPPSLKGPLPPYGDQVVIGPTPVMETRWFVKGSPPPYGGQVVEGPPLWRPSG